MNAGSDPTKVPERKVARHRRSGSLLWVPGEPSRHETTSGPSKASKSGPSTRRTSTENTPVLPMSPAHNFPQKPKLARTITIVAWDRPWGPWPDSSGLYQGPPFPQSRTTKFTGDERTDFANSVRDWYDRDFYPGHHVGDEELLEENGLLQLMWDKRRLDRIQYWDQYEAVPGSFIWGAKGSTDPGVEYASERIEGAP